MVPRLGFDTAGHSSLKLCPEVTFLGNSISAHDEVEIRVVVPPPEHPVVAEDLEQEKITLRAKGPYEVDLPDLAPQFELRFSESAPLRIVVAIAALGE